MSKDNKAIAQIYKIRSFFQKCFQIKIKHFQGSSDAFKFKRMHASIVL